MPPKTARLFIKIGLTLHCAMALCLVITAVEMIRVMQQITVFGTGNAAALNIGISGALRFALVGFSLGLPGLILFLLGVFRGGIRNRWVFWSGIAVSLLWMIGLVKFAMMGLPLFLLFLWKQKEFVPPGTNPEQR